MLLNAPPCTSRSCSMCPPARVVPGQARRVSPPRFGFLSGRGRPGSARRGEGSRACVSRRDSCPAGTAYAHHRAAPEGQRWFGVHTFSEAHTSLNPKATRTGMGAAIFTNEVGSFQELSTPSCSWSSTPPVHTHHVSVSLYLKQISHACADTGRAFACLVTGGCDT